MFRTALSVVGFALVVPSISHATEYTIDKAHSAAMFKAHHLGAGYTYGQFLDVTGTIKSDQANPAGDMVDVTVKTDSLTSHEENRDKHLKSPDFFNTKQFPTLTFKSKSVAKVDDKTLNVTGDLTIHGVTKPVTAKVTYTGTGKNPQNGTEMIGYETTIAIKRSDYGMIFMVPMIDDDVTLIIALEGDAKK